MSRGTSQSAVPPRIPFDLGGTAPGLSHPTGILAAPVPGTARPLASLPEGGIGFKPPEVTKKGTGSERRRKYNRKKTVAARCLSPFSPRGPARRPPGRSVYFSGSGEPPSPCPLPEGEGTSIVRFAREPNLGTVPVFVRRKRDCRLPKFQEPARYDCPLGSSDVAAGLARAARQSARHLRPGRPAPAGQHRPPQRLRLGPAHRHSRQGPGADPDLRLLVRAAGRAQPPDHHRRGPDGPAAGRRPAAAGRPSTLCRKTQVVPIECVVRGYLAGSGWKEYRKRGTVCGIKLPAGLDRECPAAGADLHARHQGRDRPRREHLVRARWSSWSAASWPRSCAAAAWPSSSRGADYALQRGIIIADTKFEWGEADGQIILIDEVLTPDSSRFWPADQLRPGPQPALVRQAVRARLALGERLGQEQPPARPAGRDRGRRRGRSTSRPTSG